MLVFADILDYSEEYIPGATILEHRFCRSSSEENCDESGGAAEKTWRRRCFRVILWRIAAGHVDMLSRILKHKTWGSILHGIYIAPATNSLK